MTEEKVVSLLNYPEKKCPTCDGTTWWYSLTEKDYKGLPTWICGTCYPPPSELARLKMRIIKGNWVLSKRRLQIDALPDETPEEKAVVWAERQAWGEGINKIQQIGKQLKQLSVDCLYIEGGKKIKKCIHGYDIIECFTCPNEYWWRQEIEDEWFGRTGERV
jgi:hypothetical protein